jgi:hypothetical protein
MGIKQAPVIMANAIFTILFNYWYNFGSNTSTPTTLFFTFLKTTYGKKGNRKKTNCKKIS